MAEEAILDQPIVEPPKEEVVVPEIEKRALSMGWRPKDDWQGNDDDFIDAKEFVRRKPLFDKIAQTSKRLQNMEETLTNFAAHHQKVKEVEYQRALKTLRNERRSALTDGDAAVALQIEDQIEVLNDEHTQEMTELRKQAAIAPAAPTVPLSSDFQSWVKNNKWYYDDVKMHKYADEAAQLFIANAQLEQINLTEPEVFAHVLDKVKEEFPERFENPNRQRPGVIVNGDRGGKKTTKSYSPSSEEQEVARNWVKQGLYKSEAEYYKELNDIKENK